MHVLTLWSLHMFVRDKSPIIYLTTYKSFSVSSVDGFQIVKTAEVVSPNKTRGWVTLSDMSDCSYESRSRKDSPADFMVWVWSLNLKYSPPGNKGIINSNSASRRPVKCSMSRHSLPQKIEVGYESYHTLFKFVFYLYYCPLCTTNYIYAHNAIFDGIHLQVLYQLLREDLLILHLQLPHMIFLVCI